MNKNFIATVHFFVKYRTLHRVTVDPANDQLVIFLSNDTEKRTARYCPHQGAPLEKYYRLKKGILVCNWHGCRFAGTE